MQITSKSEIDSNAVTPQSLKVRAMPSEIGSSPDRHRRLVVQIDAACRSPSSPSEIARQSSRCCLVTEFASAALAFRPPCSTALVLPPSRYFIFLSLSIEWNENYKMNYTISLSLSLFFNKTNSLLVFWNLNCVSHWPNRTSPLLILSVFDISLFECVAFHV